MLLSTQISGVCSRFGFERGVEILHEAGYDCLDLSMFEMIRDDAAFCQPNWREIAEQRRKFCDERGIVFNQSHAPFAFAWGNHDIRDTIAKPRVEQSIEIAGIMGVKVAVVHPLHWFDYKGHEEEIHHINLDYYNELIPVARNAGVKVALENMWQKEVKRRCISDDVASRAEEHARFIDEIDSEWVVACLDVGHSSLIGEEAEDTIRILGKDRLKALHVHDNCYTNDDHQLPGLGKMNWNNIMGALKEIGYTGELTYEADGFLRYFENDYIPQACKFMEQTGRYLLSKLDKE